MGPTANLAKLLGKSGLPGARSPTGSYPSSSSSCACATDVLLRAPDGLPHEPERLNEPSPVEENELERDPERTPTPVDGYGGRGEIGDGATYEEIEELEFGGAFGNLEIELDWDNKFGEVEGWMTGVVEIRSPWI